MPGKGRKERKGKIEEKARVSGDNPLRACPKIELAMAPSRGISFAWGTPKKGCNKKDKEKERKGKEKRRKRKRE